ncbi:MAG TPA: TetR/AcrR family transcriptional regulator [Polyangiaceae bacterium LLY-WYZ-15_(1-7)]|nr:hypothetical protein [Myxococcales bacterium]MAT24899.1 hypothetical protein [Sandaracinus sp.]HJK92899.1 TetR/AcrR family transcriptional regulator [Polyangiaceae bacterium LLY-WYZ-15_(1-7)]HJL00918.1 TetR/AcrR family transcriptional regulator [Polyangiaceae bacterium LLY-WYZ-15_(1-7)]HJL12964.1 TetR/AcrR family transcriptional regulator [Polyangiaceae bacterium LLY-WYZ-15_(1-7)]
MLEVDGVRVPQQPRSRRTRAKLLEGAQRAFSELGYASATARVIAERAGVSAGSFYQYFRDKDAVLRELAVGRFQGIATRALAILDDDAEPPAADLERDARQRMAAVVEAVMAYHYEDPGLHQVLHERRAYDRELDHLTRQAEAALFEAIAGLLARWEHSGDHAATAFVLFGMVEGTIHAHCLGGPVVPDDRFVDALVDALVRVALPHRSPGS